MHHCQFLVIFMSVAAGSIMILLKFSLMVVLKFHIIHDNVFFDIIRERQNLNTTHYPEKEKSEVMMETSKRNQMAELY